MHAHQIYSSSPPLFSSIKTLKHPLSCRLDVFAQMTIQMRADWLVALVPVSSRQISPGVFSPVCLGRSHGVGQRSAR